MVAFRDLPRAMAGLLDAPPEGHAAPLCPVVTY